MALHSKTRTVSRVALIGFTTLAFSASDVFMLGFTPERAVEQRDLESEFDAHLNAEHLEAWMKQMSAAPQHVGSPQAKANALFMVDLFRSWGYDADTVVYHVLFPTPRTRELELVHPTRFVAGLTEPEVEGDASSAVREHRLPPYNAYSADGEVSGELVYVNQGLQRDYEELARRGIDVKDKIVIARYGGSWRGIKPKLAAQRGAVGCILYSDPREDGFFQGDVYPEGPFRMAHGVQLGSVADMPLFPGDPLTPGVGATREAERLPLEEAPTLLQIPVLPISYGDALPLLEALDGPVAPAAWRGALPITYHIGPGPAAVRLKVEFNWDLVPAYNVVAKLHGSEWPDEWVVRGNHRDGWVFGALDPLSGMVALMEEARAVGELARSGNRPRRTIVYAGWDAEEPGLLGSTEWAEHNADELRQKAVVYINTDSNGRGFLNGGGSHSLERLFNEVAASVSDPQTGVTVAERKRAQLRLAGNPEVDSRTDLRISPLGSGSDYTPFLQHLGIASLHLGFGGENRGGSYHSAFDTYHHYVRFGDPGFAYGIGLAQVAGRLTLRIANADVLPMRMHNLADNVGRFVAEVVELATTLRADHANHNRLVETNSFTLAADPTRPFVAPGRKADVPHLNFAPLLNALSQLKQSAVAYDRVLEGGIESIDATQMRSINQVLLNLERSMTQESGLPGRKWFKHYVYAPGFYTGYGVKTIPGVREALERGDWAEAEAQVLVAAEVLERLADAINRAGSILAQ